MLYFTNYSIIYYVLRISSIINYQSSVISYQSSQFIDSFHCSVHMQFTLQAMTHCCVNNTILAGTVTLLCAAHGFVFVCIIVGKYTTYRIDCG
jgi:hypothetical protein